MIFGFVPGDDIDLVGIDVPTGVVFGVDAATGATLGANNVLTVNGLVGGTVTLNLDPAQDYSNVSFIVEPDGSGGTEIKPYGFLSIDAPGADPGSTGLLNINDSGQIVGSYTTGSGTLSLAYHNFLATDIPLVSCFTAGTRIRTTRGYVAVDTLCNGIALPTHFSGEEVPVVWIGHRKVNCYQHPNPATVWPVAIKAEAFGTDRPLRDLWLSPDHAVFVDNALIPIKHLINGTTITQVPVDEVTYYHIELDHHDVLLAEGLPCESFLDTGDRHNFSNGGGAISLFAEFSSCSTEAPAIWEAFACAPLVVAGPELLAVKKRLDARTAVPERSEMACRKSRHIA